GAIAPDVVDRDLAAGDEVHRVARIALANNELTGSEREVVHARAEFKESGVVEQTEDRSAAQDIDRIGGASSAFRGGLHFEKVADLLDRDAGAAHRKIETVQDGRYRLDIVAGPRGPDHRGVADMSDGELLDDAGWRRIRRHIGNRGCAESEDDRVDHFLRVNRVRHV